MKLPTEGKPDAAAVMKEIVLSSLIKATKYRRSLDSLFKSQVFTAEDDLSLFIEFDLWRNNYVLLRKTLVKDIRFCLLKIRY